MNVVQVDTLIVGAGQAGGRDGRICRLVVSAMLSLKRHG